METAIIKVGPLLDGKVYSYEPLRGIWSDDEGEADFLSHEMSLAEGEVRRYYFDTGMHKWLDKNYVKLSIEESMVVNMDFKDEYGINGDVVLLTLDE